MLWFFAARLALASLLLLAGSGTLTGSEPVPGIDIGVRSSVDERWQGFRKHGAIEHGKIYALVAIKESPSAQKLVQSVDEARLVQWLRTELNKRGFTEITTPTQKPDVVLTVLYGRGFLRNPYLKGTILDEDSDIVPVATLILPDQAMRQREVGYEAKLQAAQQEKLFIRVTAWKYPDSPKEKPKDLWKTTMLVDDPAHRDLNGIVQEMLAAGAGYFDRQIKEEEVKINSGVPQGKVTIAPFKVLETVPTEKPKEK